MSAGPSRLSAQTSSSQTSLNSPKKRQQHTLDNIFEKQDRGEVERLSLQYRELLSQADETKTDLANRTLKDLRNTLAAGELLFAETRDTNVASLDAKLLTSTAESAVALARKMRTDTSSFDVDEFLIKLNGMLGLDRMEREDMSPADELEESQSGPSRPRYRQGVLGDWAKIGWMAAKHTRRVPGVEFMYGPLTVEHTKRVTQRRQRKASLGPEIRPQEIHNAPKEGPKPDDMSTNVIKVYKIIQEAQKRGPVNFFQLVINPDDYGQTVENIFYASFLIKDGTAGIQVDENGLITIRTETGNDIDENSDAIKNQAVIELDMDTWREAKRVFNITRPMIPHRDYGLGARPANGTWYT